MSARHKGDWSLSLECRYAPTNCTCKPSRPGGIPTKRVDRGMIRVAILLACTCSNSNSSDNGTENRTSFFFLLLQSDNFGLWVWIGPLNCCHRKLQSLTDRSRWIFFSLVQGRSEPSSPSETLVARFASLSLSFSLLTKIAPGLSERADLAISSHWQVV